MEGGLTYYDLYSDRCSWRDILHNLPWKDFKTREDGKMVKVRLQVYLKRIKFLYLLLITIQLVLVIRQKHLTIHMHGSLERLQIFLLILNILVTL